MCPDPISCNQCRYWNVRDEAKAGHCMNEASFNYLIYTLPTTTCPQGARCEP